MASPVGVSRADTVVELPLSVVQASAGFSLDVGGSVIKIAYRSKEDFDNGVPKMEKQAKTAVDKGRIHLVLLDNGDPQHVVDFVRARCDLTCDNEGQRVIYCTGVAADKVKPKVKEQLNVILRQVPEFACAAAALCLLLKELPLVEVFHPVCERGLEEGCRVSQGYTAMLRAASQTSKGKLSYHHRTPEVYDVTADQRFPCIVVTCGSVVAVQRMEADGTCEFIESTRLGGMFFFGLSSIITGQSNFEVLSELVAESDGRSVDAYIEDLNPEDEDNMFSEFNPGVRMFPLSKAITKGRDKAKKGDVVHSILETVCESTAQMAYQWAQNEGVPRVYFSGNFVNIPKAQQFITRYMHLKQHRKGLHVNFEFIQHGGHLCALGAFIQSNIED